MVTSLSDPEMIQAQSKSRSSLREWWKLAEAWESNPMVAEASTISSRYFRQYGMMIYTSLRTFLLLHRTLMSRIRNMQQHHRQPTGSEVTVMIEYHLPSY